MNNKKLLSSRCVIVRSSTLFNASPHGFTSWAASDYVYDRHFQKAVDRAEAQVERAKATLRRRRLELAAHIKKVRGRHRAGEVVHV